MEHSAGTKTYLIPTKRRAQISHLLSFPVGAEKISAALAAVPQISELVLLFVQDWYDRIHFKRYPYLSVLYFEKNWPGSLNPYHGRWSIRVHPVRRSFRARVQKHILAETLPTIATWLTDRRELDQIGEDRLVFLYDEESDSFYTEASTKLLPGRS